MQYFRENTLRNFSETTGKERVAFALAAFGMLAPLVPWQWF
jgi:hypothetical protein